MNKKAIRKIQRLAALTRHELHKFISVHYDVFDYDWACSCLVCAWALEKILKAHGFKAELCIGEYDSCTHAFVVVDGYVVDITATQFQRPEVVVELFEGSDYVSEFKGIKAHKHISTWPRDQVPNTYKQELSNVIKQILRKHEGGYYLYGT